MTKNIFRKQCLLKLKKQKDKSCFALDKKISQRIYQEIKASSAKSIMLYIPLRIEVNIMPLIRQLKKEKTRLLVPFMEGESFRLVKYRLPLKRKIWYIRT